MGGRALPPLSLSLCTDLLLVGLVSQLYSSTFLTGVMAHGSCARTARSTAARGARQDAKTSWMFRRYVGCRVRWTLRFRRVPTQGYERRCSLFVLAHLTDIRADSNRQLTHSTWMGWQPHCGPPSEVDGVALDATFDAESSGATSSSLAPSMRLPQLRLESWLERAALEPSLTCSPLRLALRHGA